MKKYIKASFDPSMPAWLRHKDKSNEIALKYLIGQYSMGEAKFYDTLQPDSIPIYLLYEVYATFDDWRGEHKSAIPQLVYVPECKYSYDDFWIKVDKNKFRRVATAAKAKIDERTADIVYMIAPKKADVRIPRAENVDPRYKREWDEKHSTNHWKYQGQYKEYPYNWETGTYDYSNPYWKMPYLGWNDKKRDKSGYELPTPEDLYKRLYQKFPNIVQGRIDMVKSVLDEYYNKIADAKNEIFSQYDIRRGKYIAYGSQSPINDLNYAINAYSSLYQRFEECIHDDGTVDSKQLAQLTNGKTNSLNYYKSSIDKDLENIRYKLH